MSFFKLRSNRAHDEQGATGSSPSQSIESLRRSARHRLIGATVLVLIAVVGFPLLFDTQPRPVKSDIQIEISDKDKVKSTDAPVLSKASNSSNTSNASNASNANKIAAVGVDKDKDERSKDQSASSSGSSAVTSGAAGVAAGVVAASAMHSFSSAMSAITTPPAPSNLNPASDSKPGSVSQNSSTQASGSQQQKGDSSSSTNKSSNGEPKEVIISAKAPSSSIQPAKAASSVVTPVVPSSSSAASSVSANAGASATPGASVNSSNASNTQSTSSAKDIKDAKDSANSKDASSKDTKQVKQIIQVGVYTDPVKIKEYSSKLEKAGYKVTLRGEPGKDGTKRVRIRVGIFKNKDEALHAVEKLKELKIPGAKLDIIPQP